MANRFLDKMFKGTPSGYSSEGGYDPGQRSIMKKLADAAMGAQVGGRPGGLAQLEKIKQGRQQQQMQKAFRSWQKEMEMKKIDIAQQKVDIFRQKAEKPDSAEIANQIRLLQTKIDQSQFDLNKKKYYNNMLLNIFKLSYQLTPEQKKGGGWFGLGKKPTDIGDIEKTFKSLQGKFGLNLESPGKKEGEPAELKQKSSDKNLIEKFKKTKKGTPEYIKYYNELKTRGY